MIYHCYVRTRCPDLDQVVPLTEIRRTTRYTSTMQSRNMKEKAKKQMKEDLNI
jgi:hypothetical protein